MRLQPLFYLAFALATLLGIASSSASAQQAACTADQPAIHSRLLAAGVLDPNRALAHCDHLCNLHFSGEIYPVIDLTELVIGASVPRGVQRVVIMDPRWKKPVKTIAYEEQRPLFCRDSKQIVFFGDLPNPSGQPGNVAVFQGPELDIAIKKLDLNSLPTIAAPKPSRPQLPPN